MSKVNYDTKNVKQLREMLGELGLSDKGDVAQLRIRHERFINLWNSEVDAPKPRSRNTLLREMAQWESAVSKAKPAPKVNSSETWLVSARPRPFSSLNALYRIITEDSSTNSSNRPDLNLKIIRAIGAALARTRSCFRHHPYPVLDSPIYFVSISSVCLYFSLVRNPYFGVCDPFLCNCSAGELGLALPYPFA